ncbi:MAG TPA: glycine cleavage system aminomethyltransferase GcvT [Aigarchaeota archaeon]|nr:glycine cleavage system aminomethyltransferase GcvT [Aigarchaeota archaeon]
MNETPLLRLHRESGAEIGEFAGWRSPLWFTTVKEEHNAVRNRAGVFDISHMTRIRIRGKESTQLLEKLLTRDVSKTKINRMKYCLMLNERGGIIDDITFYRLGEEDYVIVSNAATRRRVVEWLTSNSEDMDVEINDYTEESILLAVQGPEAKLYLERVLNRSLEAIRWFAGFEADLTGCSLLITRSGYTGEDGFELNVLKGDAGGFERLWEELLSAGLTPCGLACRDVLRLEAGYPLYGQDMDEETTPFEAGLEWAVKMEKPGFVGREALSEAMSRGLRSLLVGVEMLEQGIPRRGYRVYSSSGEGVGDVTSGVFSYSLGRGIALARIDPGSAGENSEVRVEIHGRLRKARVRRGPFVEHRIPVK